MKVTNWCRKLAATIFSSGVCIPGTAYAVDIPLGDPSFEAFTVPAGSYAYSDTYRPTSAWVDDLDSPGNGFYYQDDGNSNWLYDAAYAVGSVRPAPRTGNQAMHGLGYYNAQETGAVFEAGKTYTFSLWHRADSDATFSGVFMYVFDGSVPFSDANSLSNDLFTPSPSGSWQQINHLHTVVPGAPEIGHPVGVGFVPRSDSAVDDASLRVDPSEDVVLFLEINTTNGQTVIKNQSGETVHIDYYEIMSAGNSLNEGGWNSFQNPAGNPPGFPSFNTGSGWKEAGGSDDGVLSESYLAGNSGVTSGASISLGAAYSVGDPQDIVFRYGWVTGASVALDGDYNGDGVVNAADYVMWRKTNINGSAGYNTWRANFGESGGGPTGVGRLTSGFVRYVTGGSGAGVPEPTTLILVGAGIAGWASAGRRKTSVR